VVKIFDGAVPRTASVARALKLEGTPRGKRFMSKELASDMQNVHTSGVKSFHGAALAPGPPKRPRCAGTETPEDVAPCAAPVTVEVDGLHLCGPHAEEFEAEARVDILEVAASYLSRWLRFAREELCNDELARRLEEAREGVRVEADLALGALERVGGDPRRCSPRQTGIGARRAASRSEVGGNPSSAGTEDTAGLRRDRRVGGRRGGRAR